MKPELKQTLAGLAVQLGNIKACLQRVADEQLDSLDAIMPDTADYDTVSYSCDALSDAMSFIDDALFEICEAR